MFQLLKLPLYSYCPRIICFRQCVIVKTLNHLPVKHHVRKPAINPSNCHHRWRFPYCLAGVSNHRFASAAVANGPASVTGEPPESFDTIYETVPLASVITLCTPACWPLGIIHFSFWFEFGETAAAASKGTLPPLLGATKQKAPERTHARGMFQANLTERIAIASPRQRVAYHQPPQKQTRRFDLTAGLPNENSNQ